MITLSPLHHPLLRVSHHLSLPSEGRQSRPASLDKSVEAVAKSIAVVQKMMIIVEVVVVAVAVEAAGVHA